jgi:hypothetical protein
MYSVRSIPEERSASFEIKTHALLSRHGVYRYHHTLPHKDSMVLWLGLSESKVRSHATFMPDASLYETFEPREARRLAERLDIHYTPKHGSWLNMAEIELSVLKGQCLDRRIPDMATMQTQVAAWERDRNNSASKIVWQFTTPDARIKLSVSNQQNRDRRAPLSPVFGPHAGFAA